jgi:hypothetical protein
MDERQRRFCLRLAGVASDELYLRVLERPHEEDTGQRV